MSRDHVKFYSSTDMSCGISLQAAELLLEDFDEHTDISNVNQALEYYNIYQLTQSSVRLIKWSEEETDDFVAKANKLVKAYSRYFNKEIDDSNFVGIFISVDKLYYQDDFWHLINQYKVFSKIDPFTFQQVLLLDKCSIVDILHCKGLVNFFSSVLYNYLLNNPRNAELFLGNLIVSDRGEKQPLYFPNELSLADKEQLLNSYIDDAHPNPNFLDIIQKAKDSSTLRISEMTRLKAKRKRKAIELDMFVENTGMQFTYGVCMIDNHPKCKELCINGREYIVKYDATWIRENLDYPTLLNNFLYLFEFADLQMRVLLVSKPNQGSIFERLLTTKTIDSYPAYSSFTMNECFATLDMQAYINLLQQSNIRFEDIIHWFFTSYLLQEFGVANYTVRIPSESSVLFEKCQTMSNAIETIAKQFKMLVEYNMIDLELLQISSSPTLYAELPSLLPNKYVYGSGKDFNKACFLLFSDQCLLCHVERKQEYPKSFFELIYAQAIEIGDYKDQNQQLITWLADNNFVTVDSVGVISPVLNNVMILRQLYQNEVISYWNTSTEERKTIDELSNIGYLEFDSSLLSKPEASYFNYYLNQVEFDNGPDLRNKYSHGINQIIEDENVHRKNYLIFLTLIVLLIIKINDEYCSKEKLSEETTTVSTSSDCGIIET